MLQETTPATEDPLESFVREIRARAWREPPGRRWSLVPALTSILVLEALVAVCTALVFLR